eukprot:31046-Pelagococcus_subviridis.AAC.3
MSRIAARSLAGPSRKYFTRPGSHSRSWSSLSAYCASAKRPIVNSGLDRITSRRAAEPGWLIAGSRGRRGIIASSASASRDAPPGPPRARVAVVGGGGARPRRRRKEEGSVAAPRSAAAAGAHVDRFWREKRSGVPTGRRRRDNDARASASASAARLAPPPSLRSERRDAARVLRRASDDLLPPRADAAVDAPPRRRRPPPASAFVAADDDDDDARALERRAHGDARALARAAPDLDRAAAPDQRPSRLRAGAPPGAAPLPGARGEASWLRPSLSRSPREVFFFGPFFRVGPRSLTRLALPRSTTLLTGGVPTHGRRDRRGRRARRAASTGRRRRAHRARGRPAVDRRPDADAAEEVRRVLYTGPHTTASAW